MKLYFSVYLNEKKIKIYNVSLVSKVPKDVFPKISYTEFFKMLDTKMYNQAEIQKDARRRLTRLEWHPKGKKK